MIITNSGYLKLQDVLDMVEKGNLFGIYLTHKGTNVLVSVPNLVNETLYFPIQNKLPYKILEGKKITTCIKQLFNSETNDVNEIDTSTWNNGEQIMSYTLFTT